MITGRMKKTNSILLAVILSLPINPLFADDAGLARLMSKFAGLSERKAAFIEERHAYYLDAPLMSQGQLKATPPDRLEKTIVTPEPIQQVISGDRLIHAKNGETVREITLSQQPVLAAAINALRAVLFGDLGFLQKHFQTRYENSKHKWKLKLIPRQKQIIKYIRSITVSGADDTVSEFLITEANGDYSKTRLYEVQQ